MMLSIFSYTICHLLISFIEVSITTQSPSPFFSYLRYSFPSGRYSSSILYPGGWTNSIFNIWSMPGIGSEAVGKESGITCNPTVSTMTFSLEFVWRRSYLSIGQETRKKEVTRCCRHMRKCLLRCLLPDSQVGLMQRGTEAGQGQRTH